MTKAERLSKKYFRIGSWNCASAGKRIEVIEKLACDFDILCLQETRTRPEKPLDIPDHTIVQSHADRGIAIVFHNKLSSRISTIDLTKWCTSSTELLGIRVEKPDQRNASVVVINTYIHPSKCTNKADWGFLEEIEDELGDAIIMCGDFNARSQMWDSQGTNPQGRALEDKLVEILCDPFATAMPTHLGTRPGDTDSTIDLALVSPKLTPSINAQTLASHGSDHLPVAFSLQKPCKRTEKQTCSPFTYTSSDRNVISHLRAKKQQHAPTGQKRTKIQPPWWNSETEKAWNEKRVAVKIWQKERRKHTPDQAKKMIMEDKTNNYVQNTS